MRQRLLRSAPCSILFPLLVLTLVLAAVHTSYAQGAPHTLTATVSSGGRVTLRWQAPPTPGFSGYLIEAGASSGATAVSHRGGNVLLYGVDAPNGPLLRPGTRVVRRHTRTPGPNCTFRMTRQ